MNIKLNELAIKCGAEFVKVDQLLPSGLTICDVLIFSEAELESFASAVKVMDDSPNNQALIAYVKELRHILRHYVSEKNMPYIPESLKGIL